MRVPVTGTFEGDGCSAVGAFCALLHIMHCLFCIHPPRSFHPHPPPPPLHATRVYARQSASSLLFALPRTLPPPPPLAQRHPFDSTGVPVWSLYSDLNAARYFGKNSVIRWRVFEKFWNLGVWWGFRERREKVELYGVVGWMFFYNFGFYWDWFISAVNWGGCLIGWLKFHFWWIVLGLRCHKVNSFWWMYTTGK